MNEIVAAVAFRDSVFIFTRDGSVYRMSYSDFDGHIQFQKMIELFNK